MPLFRIESGTAKLVKQRDFRIEKEIQSFVEKNLEEIFDCKFIATEYSTGSEHGGRIDTLALSEDNSPVIIEYKNTESSDLINQSLFYLSWIKDHKGDFQIAVQSQLKSNVEIDWSEVRVICIAPGFRKYDLHAVKMMGANIELWQFKLYDNDCISFEEVFRRSNIETSKNSVMVEAGKKAAVTRANGVYNLETHLEKMDKDLRSVFEEMREFILSLDETIEETPKKFYVAYKLTQNFVCAEAQRDKIKLFLKLNPKTVEMPQNGRDVSEIGHFGTGDLELTVTDQKDFEVAKSYIEEALKEIGG
jgi:predicted transport protein